MDKKIVTTFIENAHKPENLAKLEKVFGLNEPEPDKNVLNKFDTKTLIDYLYQRVCIGHKFSTGYVMYHNPISDKDEATDVKEKIIEVLTWLCPEVLNVDDKIIVMKNINIDIETKLEEISKEI